MGFSQDFSGSVYTRAAGQLLDVVVLDVVSESGCECQLARACAVDSVPTPQQTKQEAPQAGDSPLPYPAIPFSFTPLWALQSGVSHGCRATAPSPPAPSPPASMAISILQELGWILLSCLCAPWDVSQGGEAREAGGNRVEQQGPQWLLTPGTLAEAWAPFIPSFLLNLFVSVTSGNFHWVCLCRVWPLLSPGSC